MINSKKKIRSTDHPAQAAATSISTVGLSAFIARIQAGKGGAMASALAGLLLAISGCAQQKEAPATLPCLVVARAKLPISLHEGKIMVSVKLNDQPVRMMVDTGSNISVIAPHIAESLGGTYNRDRLVQFDGMGGHLDAQHPYKVKTIQLGPLHWFDFEVMVAHVARAKKRNAPDAAAGIIGSDLLRRYDVEFDFQRGEMAFYQAPNCKGDFVPWVKPYKVLHSPPNRRGFFIVPVELNGRTLSALVDTGANAIFVDRTAAIAVGIDPTALEAAPKIPTIGIDGVEVPTRFYRFDSMDIADRKFRHHPLAVSDAPLPNGIDMLLGMDFWWHYRMWMSYQTGQVFIQEHFRTPDVILPWEKRVQPPN